MLLPIFPVVLGLLCGADAPVRIGVLKVQVAEDPVLGQALTVALVAEVRRRAVAAEVFGPDDVAALTGAGRASSCTDVSCFAAMGGGAGVDQVLLANVGKLGLSDVLSLALLDVRRASVIGAVEGRGSPQELGEEGGDRADPIDRLEGAVARLFATAEPQVTAGALDAPLDPWPAGAGRIQLRAAEPGALALLDDRPLLVGAATDVPSGLHRLRVFSADFARSWDAAIEVPPGALKVVEVALAKGTSGMGSLEVVAEPGARIEVDGVALGLAPLPPFAATCGTHAVRVVHGDREATMSVDVSLHAAARIAPALVPVGP